MLRNLSLAFLILMLLPGTVSAATYYLDAKSGNDDTGDGSSGSPWRTLAHAQSVVQSGDTIILRDGDYGEFSESSASGRTDWITYKAEEGHTPRFTKIDLYYSSPTDSYLRFDGINVTVEWVNPCDSGETGCDDPQYPTADQSTYAKTSRPVTVWQANHVEVINCLLQGTNKHLTNSGVWMDTVDDILIEHNEIKTVGTIVQYQNSNNVRIINNHGYEHRSSCFSEGNSNVYNTLIEANYCHDSNFDFSEDYCRRIDPYHGSAIAIRNGDLIIRNNIFHDGWTSSGIMFYGGTDVYSDILVENNILYDIHNPFVFRVRYLGDNVVFRNNLFAGRYDLNDYGEITSDGRWRHGTALSLESIADGYDGSGLSFYNNIFVGRASFGENAAEDYNIIWWNDNAAADPDICEPKGEHSKVLTCSYSNSPTYFEDGTFFEGGISEGTMNFYPLHGKPLDFHFAEDSEGINFGDPAHQTSMGLGTIGPDDFIRMDGIPRDSEHHSVGPYEYPDSAQSYHRADMNEDGCVDSTELIAFMERWKVSVADVSMREMMEAIGLWKAGTGCASCTPVTCAELKYECGTPDDGCGNDLDCGTCGTHATCPSGTCVCDSGWADCNNDNSCECDLSSGSCSGGTCECTVTDTCAATSCYNGDVWCFDNCGEPDHVSVECATTEETCVDGACVIFASSCSQEAVQAAVDSASDGDTVQVPAGECAWTSRLTLPQGVNLRGSGELETILTLSPPDYTCIIRTTGNNEISNIYFYWPLSTNSYKHALWALGPELRIHDNKFDSSLDGHSKYAMVIYGGKGVFYNNELVGAAVYARAISSQLEIQIAWATERIYGSDDFMYVENNTFEASPVDNSIGRCIDAGDAGRYVFRFNHVKGFYLLAHGITVPSGGLRSTQVWEIYDNVVESGKYLSVNNWVPPIWLRGGSGLVFDNQLLDWDYNYANPILDVPRVIKTTSSCPSTELFCTTDDTTLKGACDGDNVYDGNTGETGYPCRDQIGRDKDNSQITFGSPPYASQDLVPAYLFNNTNEDNAQVNFVNHPGYTTLLSDYIQPNRDYYGGIASSFDGTSGVGSGALANRPTTCTTGVAYWATDVGEWNSLHSGADGQLYKCTSTDNWELYYTPYTYPHPLALTD